MRALLLASLALFACGKVVAPPKERPRPVEPRPSQSAAPAPAPASAPLPEKPALALAWRLQTRPFNKGVAVREGLVGALGSRHLALVETKTGKLLAGRDVCFTFSGAFAFVDEHTAGLVCEQEVQLLGLPDLDYRGSRALSGMARAAAFSQGHAAIVFDGGAVRVYETAGWSEQRALSVPDTVSAIALSRDGRRLAVGLDQGEVLLDRDGSPERLAVKLGLPLDALAFSPGGDKLFCSAGPHAAVYDVATRREEKRWGAVSGVLAAAWLDGRVIGSGGKDGLLLLDLDGAVRSVAQGLDGAEPVVAVAAPEADLLCAAERGGQLACYAQGGVPRAVAIPDHSPDEERASGRVLGVVAKRLRVKALPDSLLPEPGSYVRLLRYTEAMVGDVKSARWIELTPQAQVIHVKKGVIHLQLGDDLLPIAGVPDPLTYDTAVRLAWKRPREKDTAEE
jgi:hypothetical protein